MFCPKCATQNLEGASFCRTCGANISLVPQALTGQIPQTAPDEINLEGRRGRRSRRLGKEVSLDQSFKNIFMGIAFLLIAIALSRSIGYGWWYWMLIPAFSMLGTGIAQFIRLKEKDKQGSFAPQTATRAFQDRPKVAPLASVPQRNTGELLPPPPSVTEGTTRHLGAEAATRHLDSSSEQK